MTDKKAVLLINLGSPEKPETADIRSYLRAFLSDPRVMTMPWLVRCLILNLVILPLRPAAILPKYQKVWDGDRFLLIKHSEELMKALNNALGPDYQVFHAMRYSSPSIERVLSSIQAAGVSELLVLPLFPQYASATSGSILEKVFNHLKGWRVLPQLSVISSFFQFPGFIKAWCHLASPYLAKQPDHILFSFHGLPESHIHDADLSGQCLATEDCCANFTASNGQCYRAQCFETARLIAEGLGLEDFQYSVAFQSRLGKAKWIGPSTSETVERLARNRAKDLLVVCPSFVADCLETVEEIGNDERDDFLRHGGRSLTLVPSLNAETVWVEALKDLIKRTLERGLSG